MRKVLAGLLVIGLLLIAFFGWRAVSHYQYLQKIEMHDFKVETLRGWMTLPYVAQRYQIPVETLYTAAGIPATAENAKLSLKALAEKYALDEVAVRHAVEKVIAAYGADGDAESRGE